MSENIPTQLTLEEARDLSKVFGDMDYKRVITLMQFTKPRSKYDVLMFMDEMPRGSRVSRASLYRIVDELKAAGFLTQSNPKPMKNRPEEKLNTYQLSLKGRLAAWIYSYVLLLDPKTPNSLMEKINPSELIKILDSASGRNLYLEYLRWQRSRGNDLSQVKVNLVDFVSSFLPVVLNRPDAISDQDLALALSKLRDLGVDAPQLEPALIRKLLGVWRETMARLEYKVVRGSKEVRN